MSDAKYWEERAAMWHDKYAALAHIEREHARYKETLEQIAKGRMNGPRCVVVARRVLDGEVK